MCGISAILQTDSDDSIKDNVFRSIKQLENRGYDSVGFFFEGGSHLYKSVQKMSKVFEDMKATHICSNLAMAHTRWATHGGVSVKNSHPHESYDKNIIVVHNGIINNCEDLKNKLLSKNIQSYSETDTEVICNLLRYNETCYSHLKFDQIIKMTIEELEGTWGLVIYNKKYPNCLYTINRGCPVLLGFKRDRSRFMISSEKSGFANLIDEYLVLKSNRVEQVRLDSSGKYVHASIDLEASETFNLRTKIVPISPYPFEHWTLKEINEQPEVIKGLIDTYVSKPTGLVDFSTNLKRIPILSVEHVVFIGCGTSLNAGMLGEQYMKELCKFCTVQSKEASEFIESDIPRSSKTLFIFISQSGETKDVHHVLEIVRSRNISTLGIINVEDSLIARETDGVIYTHGGKEYGVASTKCFTLQVVVLKLLSLYFATKYFKMPAVYQRRCIQSIYQASGQIRSVIETIQRMKNELLQVLNKRTMVILGNRKTYPVAREAALKIKEISYIHSESFASGSLKHGPLALMDKSLPVIIIKIGDKTLHKMNHAYSEVIARGARVVIIGQNMEKKESKNTTYVNIPINGVIDELLAVIPFQLIAYYLALSNDIDPDFPRNLAKSVVVY